jgi:hypothetical protein
VTATAHVDGQHFYQEQRFTGGWRWFWAGVILGPGAIALIVLLGISAATGAEMQPTFLIVAGLEVVALAGLMLLLRMPVVVQVTDEGIRIRAAPFFNEDIPAAEIVSVEEVSPGLWRRYGAGVGKRYGDRRARYTVGDDAGVVIERGNGWTIVIGSERPAELAAAIRRVRDGQTASRAVEESRRLTANSQQPIANSQ